MLLLVAVEGNFSIFEVISVIVTLFFRISIAGDVDIAGASVVLSVLQIETKNKLQTIIHYNSGNIGCNMKLDTRSGLKKNPSSIITKRWTLIEIFSLYNFFSVRIIN